MWRIAQICIYCFDAQIKIALTLVRFNHLTHVDFPKVSWRRDGIISHVITEPVVFSQIPVVLIPNKCSPIVQPLLSFLVFLSPFSHIVPVFMSPPFTLRCQLWVIPAHFLKGPAWIRHYICLTAEILNYSFARAVSHSGHVERTSLFLTAMESKLSEIQVWSEILHCLCCNTHFVAGEVADRSVWWI